MIFQTSLQKTVKMAMMLRYQIAVKLRLTLELLIKLKAAAALLGNMWYLHKGSQVNRDIRLSMQLPGQHRGHQLKVATDKDLKGSGNNLDGWGPQSGYFPSLIQYSQRDVYIPPVHVQT